MQLEYIIHKMSDTTQVLELTVEKTDTKGVEMVLSRLNHLRSLYLKGIRIKLESKLIFNHMRALRSLYLHFDNNSINKENFN